MKTKNFYAEKLEDLERCHDGEGVLKHVGLFSDEELITNIRFLNYTVLPPDTTIGMHKHGEDEEIYIILEGNGVMTVDGEDKDVTNGDIIVNKPHGTHGLVNNSDSNLKILVIEVYK